MRQRGFLILTVGAMLTMVPAMLSLDLSYLWQKHVTNDLQGNDQGKMGKVTVVQMRDGKLKVSISVKHMPPGPHAVHVHEAGECAFGPQNWEYDKDGMVIEVPNRPPSAFTPRAEDFQGAGEDFNPDGKQHGFLNPAGHHNGDFDHDLLVDKSGRGHVSFTVSYLSLYTNAPNDVLGRSIIIDERGDDGRTQPSGNSGRRIACASITSRLTTERGDVW